MTRNIDAAIFDWDGVIADSHNLTVMGEKLAAVQFAGELGIKFDVHYPDWDRYTGWGRAKIGKHLFGIDDGQAEIFRKLAAEKTAECVNPRILKPIDGALGFVGWLRARGVPMGVATSSNSKIYRPSVEIFGLQDTMRVAVCHGEALDNKPLPGPYRKAMNALNVNRENTLIVEDSKSGIEAGVAAGGLVLALATTQTVDYLRNKTRAHLVAEDYDHAAYLIEPYLR